jgi:hypothetical protein
MSKYRVRNVLPMAVALNLPAESLHLRPREISRELYEKEFNAPEVQRAIKAKALVVIKGGA